MYSGYRKVVRQMTEVGPGSQTDNVKVSVPNGFAHLTAGDALQI